MNWGKGITFSFIAFAIYIFVLVGICMKQDVFLVSDDYYQQEIEYDKQIARIENTQNLTEKPRIQFSTSDKSLELQFPDTIPAERVKGKIQLFRPSDASLDVVFPLHLDNSGFQQLNLKELRKGLWTMKFTWIFEGKEYFEEKTIII